MRTVTASAISDTVAALCIQANQTLPEDVSAALARCRRDEPWPLAKTTLDLLWDNMELAGQRQLPGYGHGLRLCGAGPGCPH